MILKFKYLMVVLYICLIHVACTHEEDNSLDLVKPTGQINQPREGAIYTRGNSIIFEGVFEDDTELSECELSLSTTKTLKGWDQPWTPLKDVITLTGINDGVAAYQAFEQTVPYDIMSGYYLLEIKVVDKAGNYNIYKRNIEID